MSIAKVIEVIAESEDSFDDAVKNAVREAGRTVRNIRHVYVENMYCTVSDGEISNYRVNCKVTFVVKD